MIPNVIASGTLLPAKISIDGEHYFDGWVSRERWNGWAIPYFTRDVAVQIARQVNADADLVARYHPTDPSIRLHWVKELQAFIEVDPGGLEDAPRMYYREWSHDVYDYVYGIGGRSWCWFQADDPSPTSIPDWLPPFADKLDAVVRAMFDLNEVWDQYHSAVESAIDHDAYARVFAGSFDEIIGEVSSILPEEYRDRLGQMG